MTSTQRPLIGVAECLPPIANVSLSQGTRASVLVFPHPGSCPECATYLAALSEIAEDLRLWGTRMLVVAPGPAADPRTSDSPGYTVLADEEHTARSRVGVNDGDVAVIVADRYGAVYQVSAAGADHCLPDPGDLVELAKFIDIQCPECGVPGPEWQLACPLPLG